MQKNSKQNEDEHAEYQPARPNRVTSTTVTVTTTPLLFRATTQRGSHQ